ncbi:hypothetical protein PRK78_002003 [Emydomyces testavorans]|uniref:Phospholipase/carboxylesterase/thioesterase domain-containing protein n=1 Tax=Emydomyces testavorans TaxID=2070801 RepID=A0AAF0DFJ4_9EURO|nr:hypothetical protein PRK78_002003 [Emydomyces testavorans]
MYPEPLIIPPVRSHRQTFILLHGRGSNASKFGPALLSSQILLPLGDSHVEEHTLSSAFPHAKFVFPTASRRRATAYKRSIISQWFDNWPLEDSSASHASATEQGKQEHEYLQIDGLRETSAYIHQLLRREISLVGGDAKNVVLGGLSQGCAASLVALLLWDGDPLGAAIGMCGWLPFQMQIDDTVRGLNTNEDEDVVDGEDFNPFADEGKVNNNSRAIEESPARAIMYLKEEFGISCSSPSPPDLPFQSIPLFLGHGVEDAKVPIHFGRKAASCLSAMEMEVIWNEYPNLGHWYSESMLRDLVVFLRERLPRAQEPGV